MQVKEVAKLAGISVRTLHHYDYIGLLTPSRTTDTGYRLYSETDLERLQQILFFRELDFSLQEIKQLLDNPSFDRKKALQMHKELLLAKQKRIGQIIQTVDKTISALERGMEMEKQEMFEGFDMQVIEEHKEKYAEEVRQKYDPKVVAESQRRTANYTKEDWIRIMAEQEANYQKIIAHMDKGPADEEVQAAIAEKRALISKYYYDCTLEIFRGLGDLYINDPRFTKNIDKYRAGLAVFLREAMHIYCDRRSS